MYIVGVFMLFQQIVVFPDHQGSEIEAEQKGTRMQRHLAPFLPYSSNVILIERKRITQ